MMAWLCGRCHGRCWGHSIEAALSCARHCASDFMDFLPTPPTLTLTQIIVKREDKDTKLVVRGSFGNTQEGGIGEWEGSEGLWGEETTALFKLHTPRQGAGQRAVVEGSLGLCLLLPLVIVLEDTPLLNLWDERHSPPAQSADARQRGSLPQPDFYLGQSTADAPRVLVDGAVLKDREDWKRLGPAIRQTWPDPNRLWKQGQVA